VRTYISKSCGALLIYRRLLETRQQFTRYAASANDMLVCVQL